MTTMTRTDIHRPSAPEFDPETYIVRGFADFHPEDGFRPVQVVSALVDEGYSFRGAPHGSGQCSHCGARLRYAALLSHEPTKTLLYVGETCLDNRFSATAAEFDAMRKAAAAKAEQTRLLGKAHEFYSQHPDMVILSYIQNIRVAGGVETYSTAYTYGEEFDTREEAEAVAAKNSHNDYVITGYKRGTTWEEKTLTGKWTAILQDMAWKVQKYGDLSDKQVAFARRMLGWLAEAEEKHAEREAATEAKIAAGVEVPEGRIVIEGTVLSTKWVESQFGSTQKMLVENEQGWKVWGSVPSSIEVDKGTKVQFTATVERSKDDALFGFFKRPAKASTI
jgi:hypothetical protein